MAVPKSTAEVVRALEKEYCTECGGDCIECPLLGPLKVLEEWQEKHEAQTDMSVTLSPVTISRESSVKPAITQWAGGGQG